MITDEMLADMPDYDAGLLNDFGGGDTGWWQDYLRAEIARANEHWRSAVAALAAMPQPSQEDDLRAAREAAAAATGYGDRWDGFLDGSRDSGLAVQSALIALRTERQRGKA